MSKVISEKILLDFRHSLIMDEKSPATVKQYMRHAQSFTAFLADRELEKEHVIEYKKYLTGIYSPASVNAILAAVNRFLKFQNRHDCCVKAIKIQQQSFRSREKELTKQEYFRLLEAAKQHGNKRLYLLMQTICSTGIRVSELKFINVDAVRRGRAQVTLKGKVRQILIPRSLQQELSCYIKEMGIEKGEVFITRSGKSLDRSNILHEMKAISVYAGVKQKKVFPHNLRHLFGYQYYKAEKNLSHLADILGHSNVNTTRIYASSSGFEQQRQLDRLGLVMK